MSYPCWAKGGCKALAAAELGERIGKIIPQHRFEIYDGWSVYTVKTLPPETRFAMIHFDGDLYQSTIDALQPLFERGMVSTGAVLCLDDWNANRALPGVGERRAWRELVAKSTSKPAIAAITPSRGKGSSSIPIAASPPTLTSGVPHDDCEL